MPRSIDGAVPDTDPPALAPLALADDAPVTLTARIAGAIRDAITDGSMRPNARLSVPRLAEQLGASRTPVREALLLLESEGLVRFERNRGVRVLETPLHDLDEIFTLRLLLEVPATERAVPRLTGGDLAALHGCLDRMRARAEVADEPGFMAADREFHDLLLRAAGNARLADTVVGLRHLVRSLRPSTAGRSRTLHEIRDEHVAILDRAEAGDAAGAAGAMREHLLTTARLLLAPDGGVPRDLDWPTGAGSDADDGPGGRPGTRTSSAVAESREGAEDE